MFTNQSFFINYVFLCFMVCASCKNEAADTQKTNILASQTVVNQSFNTEDDCAWMSKWFSEECADSMTRFACNGNELLIQEMAADHDWCSGAGYLKVKTLFRKGFYENGQAKMLVLVGMEPEKQLNNPKLQECILGGSIWAQEATGWMPILKTNMIVFLQSNLHRPMKINMTDNETIRLEYLEGKKRKVMTLKVKKEGFEEPILEDL